MNKIVVIHGVEVELTKQRFYCGSKPDGTATHKMGWIAKWDNKTIGDETRDRGMQWSRPKIEPAYKTIEDIVSILEDKISLELKRKST